MPRITIAAAVFVFALVWTLPGSADVAAVDPLFSSDDVFSITLTAPFGGITNDHSDEPKYRPAELSFAGADGVIHNVSIAIRARGKSRRNPDACNFPPLRLDLPDQGTEGTVFAGQDKLKLVTQCHKRDSSHKYEQYILKEYVLYRVFNRISPVSFRARLVQVTYVDAGSKIPATSYGFFIEDKDHLAARTGLHIADVKQIERASLDPVQTNRVELFQFMVGNTDFSLLRAPEGESCCHNIVPLIASDGKYVPVPYDFDATGVVDPPYALPLEVLKIKNVKQRRYRGRCTPAAAFTQSLDELRAARPQITALFENQTGLQEPIVKTAVGYLGEFYSIIDDPKQFDSQISDVCAK